MKKEACLTVDEKIEQLRSLMAEKHLSAYIIGSDDFHGSEYVGDYFKEREYMSGFTGSAGTLVVGVNRAGLWTDGRYFLQARQQLEGSAIGLMKAGVEGVPSIAEYLADKLNAGSRIGFDGRTVSNAFVKRLEEKLGNKDITFYIKRDMVGEIWHDRPAISKEPVWELAPEYAGASRREKLAAVCRSMKENGCDTFVITALDEIAWLLNLRGNDVRYTPVFLAYMVVKENKAVLFAHREIFSDKIAKALEADGVTLEEYDTFYDRLNSLIDGSRLLIDGDNANYFIMKNIPDTTFVVDKPSPVIMMKAVKNETELENLKKAHIMDGVAVTKFIYWLKNNVKSGITELEAAKKLEEFRKLEGSYIGPSFEPIIAYKEHGAIVHYEPTQKTDAVMKDEGFCLADTGGHYTCGTTDVTRTIPLGRLSSEEIYAYTTVLKGHLNLSNAKFPYGVGGANLDCLARGPLWESGLDYRHGTGHGVGYLLSVHEGPQRFHWSFEKREPVILEEGMVISNEPGYYADGKFGVRHENLVIVRSGQKTSYGQFMYLEDLTLVPFDTAAIDKSLLSGPDIERLNRYHKRVFDELSGYFQGKELAWLKKMTHPI